MWHLICTWFISKFSRTIGFLLTKIFSNVTSSIAKDIASELYNRKALQYVKELSGRTDLNGFQKAAEFNKRFLQWLSLSGRILAESTINLLREMAVAYYKSLGSK